MNNYKNREKINEIIKFIDIPEIIVLHGARQVGKTTLMKMTMNYIEKNKKKRFFLF
ncbi:hypothetical protein KKA77_02920 [Patescibacteria group bacterium]|nr:hypothetical protein [Patescibacteria group bacterium]MBU0880513.1 hypothetical protein [Patescibacteria group bacterium]MBU1062854.1 hypothetical protein [Patescibacteria group bacterium]MBU1783509.1 hypothetical protein [Patescibacteria group bacterium]MBU2250609.1 hypothetical protein [Patescibacteria group bacterium]